MSQTATVVTVAYVIACLIGGVLAVVVWRSTSHPDAGDESVRTWSHRETIWLVIVLVGLLALLLGTIFYAPYGNTAGPRRQIVRVTAVQYAWAIAPSAVKADVPVEFQLGTRDVNHGFGIYNPDGELITQVQVIPGKTQDLVWTFHRPGTYEVRCMEFCGAKHHEMVSSFEVRA